MSNIGKMKIEDYVSCLNMGRWKKKKKLSITLLFLFASYSLRLKRYWFWNENKLTWVKLRPPPMILKLDYSKYGLNSSFNMPGLKQ
jgi:hypothetical protein